MAALDRPFWQAVTPPMRRLMLHIGQQSFAKRFYLAGGTALALQMGHRRSVDFDFFSETDEVEQRIRSDIVRSLSTFPVEILENVDGNLLLIVDGIRTGFFSYGYPMVKEPGLLENVSLASLEDIALMKCDALISRGSRKDFYDLFFITQKLPFEQIFELGEKKYPLFRDFPLMILESMTLFDNANRDVQPDLFERVSWEDVKQFFIQQASFLSSNWFSNE